ncbi:alkaline phosphatase D family protein [Halarchaeum sp. P4]|uniref:alkaline phosphatase D family protein n=1 Tax=Halarchaeum sp. P4 TaxID=3421639 RepID=UPI003EC138EC
MVNIPDHPLDESRREFLRKAVTTATVAGVGASGTAAATENNGRGPLKADPFTLGVASGDPLPDSVVLWTRLAPEPLAEDGGMPDKNVVVQWKVATDADMSNVVGTGTTKARPEYAHSVHVDLKGLEPDTEYHYQFKVGPDRSPVGRTKTAPAPDAEVEELTFAFASCQNYPYGYYTAHDHLADEDLDLAVHLGDYIYEGGADGPFDRGHAPGREIKDLADYRVRHAQYKTDGNLQDAHAACPWLVTWDDHEVENNYADAVSENNDPKQAFLERRANAYQAYFEHQPLRPSRMPDGPSLPLYRRFTYGNLAEFNVLDTRQYRDDQVYSSEAAKKPGRTILGDEQEDWLVDGLTNSTSTWNVLANQVPFAATDENPNPDVRNFGGGDKWDGYRSDRERLLALMAEDADLNPVVITGDVHRNYVYDLKADFSDPESETVGTEYVGTSISSFGDGSGMTQYGPSLGEPWRKFFNDQRGYVRCTVTPEEWRTDYRVVSTVEKPEAPVETVASFMTEAGNPGAELVSERPDVQGSLEIADVRPNQEGDLNNEYVTLANTSEEPVDLSGYIVSFEGGGQTYTFPDGASVDAGGTVTVRNGTGENTDSTFYADFGGPVLNNSDPDVVLVATPDGLVLDEASYAPV